jgi:hypothetical protein
MNAQPWFVLAVGAGAGEALLARSVASAATRRGHRVVGWANHARYVELLEGACSEVRLLASPADLREAVKNETPALVALANSLTCSSFIPAVEDYGGWVVSIETSWMPWAKGLGRHASRLDQIIAVHPDDVWRSGLSTQGGPFALPDFLRVRTTAVGWMEALGPMPIEDETVCLYLGLRRDSPTAQIGPPWAAFLGPAIEMVARERDDLKWVMVGTEEVSLPDFVQRRGWVSNDDFSTLLASSSLLLVHHGMATIQKAMVAGVPTLSFTNGESLRVRDRPTWSGDQEMHALHRCGLIEHCMGPVPPGAIARRILGLLREGRRDPAPARGGERAVLAIEQALGMR